jgi:hypothetical protein
VFSDTSHQAGTGLTNVPCAGVRNDALSERRLRRGVVPRTVTRVNVIHRLTEGFVRLRLRVTVPSAVVRAAPGKDIYAAMDEVYEIASAYLGGSGFVPEVERDGRMWAHWVVPPVELARQPLIRLYPYRTAEEGAGFRFVGQFGVRRRDLNRLTGHLIREIGWLSR